jgi:hypothetical protein
MDNINPLALHDGFVTHFFKPFSEESDKCFSKNIISLCLKLLNKNYYNNFLIFSTALSGKIMSSLKKAEESRDKINNLKYYLTYNSEGDIGKQNGYNDSSVKKIFDDKYLFLCHICISFRELETVNVASRELINARIQYKNKLISVDALNEIEHDRHLKMIGFIQSYHSLRNEKYNFENTNCEQRINEFYLNYPVHLKYLK